MVIKIRLDHSSSCCCFRYFRGVVILFLGVVKGCMFLSFLLSIPPCFVVVRFETGEGCLWEITVTPQSLVLSRCDDNKECGVTTNVVLGYGYRPRIPLLFSYYEH